MAENATTALSIASVSPAPSALAPRRGMALVKRSLFTLTAEELQRLDWLAKALASSQLSYAKNGKSALSEGDLKIIMLKGMEIGLEPMMALESIDLISGKPTLDPAGMLALAQASGELEDLRVLEESDAASEIEMKRRGQSSYRRRWSIEDAARMRTTEWSNGQSRSIPLTEKSNWQQQPSVMLKWRNVAAICRVVFGDIIQGMYTPEELGADVQVDEGGGMTVVGKPVASAPALQSGRVEDAAGEDAPSAPALHWTNNQDTVNTVYDRLIAKTLATSRDDARDLLSKAGIDLKAYPTVQAMTDLVARIETYLARPAAEVPQETEPEQVDVLDAPPAPRPAEVTLTSIMDGYVRSMINKTPAEVLAVLGHASWDEIGNRTDAEQAVNAAIVQHNLPFLCKKVRYKKVGNGGKKIELVTPNNYGVPLFGGVTALLKFVGAADPLEADRFQAMNGADAWKLDAPEPIKLVTPLWVEWAGQGKDAEVIGIEPVFPDELKAA